MNGQSVALKQMEPACEFIDQSMECTIPVNTFFVFDTHSDALTGGITAPQVAPVSEVVSKFCGKPILDAMKQATEAVHWFAPSKNLGWYKDSPLYCGGWRGIFLATCGLAVRVPSGFKDLKVLVDR